MTLSRSPVLWASGTFLYYVGVGLAAPCGPSWLSLCDPAPGPFLEPVPGWGEVSLPACQDIRSACQPVCPAYLLSWGDIWMGSSLAFPVYLGVLLAFAQSPRKIPRDTPIKIGSFLELSQFGCQP